MSELSSRPPRARLAASRSPGPRLIWGLALSLLTVLGFCLYAAYEIGSLRDRQLAASERNRRDSLQLLRIQNNLSSLAVTLRDMMDRTEPYPIAAWKNTFDRLRIDLTQALAEERPLAPERPASQQAQLTDAANHFWQAIDRAFSLASAKDEVGAIEVVRESALPRQSELAGLVSQFLIRNTQVEDDAVAASREVYTRVIRQIYILMAVLLLAVGITGLLNVRATRRAFDDQRKISRQMRALTWRMLRMQEQLQARFARELHDEFGQILTVLTMLIGRAKSKIASMGSISSSSSASSPSSSSSPSSPSSPPSTNGTIVARPQGKELRLVGGSDASRSLTTMENEDPVPDPSLLDTADLEFSPGSSFVEHDKNSAASHSQPPDSTGPESFQSTFVRDLEEVEALTKDTLDRIRRDARLLHPTVLDDFGLEEALCEHVLEFGRRHRMIAWFSRNKPIGDVSEDVRTNVFRIVQEALTNVGRHSGTTEVWVRLKKREDHLRVEIEDFGRGLPQWRPPADGTTPRRSAAEAGLGMIGMRERAESLGGSFDVVPGERGGVLVIVELPLDARMPDESYGLLADDGGDSFHQETPEDETETETDPVPPTRPRSRSGRSPGSTPGSRSRTSPNRTM